MKKAHGRRVLVLSHGGYANEQSSGTYTKIGKKHFCSFMFQLGNKNSGTGDVSLTGLRLLTSFLIQGKDCGCSYYWTSFICTHTSNRGNSV